MEARMKPELSGNPSSFLEFYFRKELNSNCLKMLFSSKFHLEYPKTSNSRETSNYPFTKMSKLPSFFKGIIVYL